MSKESIEKLARKKAESAAKQEALIVQFAVFIIFIFVASIMAATGITAALFTIVILTGLLVSLAIYLSMKPYTYKKYYEKYLEEFTILRGHEK